MKITVLTFLAISAATILARAEDVALISFRVAGDKTPRQVAIGFYEGDAPAHVANFKKLAEDGFYKGLAIHRAFAHTLVQVGDPLTKKNERAKVGTGGPGWTVPSEIHRKHIKGAVAAARLPDKINPSRHSNGSQFYICLQPMPNLDGQYTVFGEVIYGLDVLDALSTKPVDTNDYPVDRIEIRSVKIMPRAELPPAPQPAPANAPKAAKRWYQIF